MTRGEVLTFTVNQTSQWTLVKQENPRMTSEYTQTFLLIVMGTEFLIKRYLNAFGFACSYVFVCMYVCLCIAVALHESFRWLLHARKTEKQTLHYYSNEYALGSKWYNFPLTPTRKMPRMAQGNLWHLTLLAPNTAVLLCCSTPDLSPLETHNNRLYNSQLFLLTTIWPQ